MFVRDALLDPDISAAPDYRRRLEASYHAVDEALQQYVPVLDSQPERTQVARLRGEIADFRRTMLDVLDSDPHRWPHDARVLLRTRIVPKRELVIRLSEEAQTLNRGAFVQQQSAIAAVYGVTQQRNWTMLGATLLASLGIAGLCNPLRGTAGRSHAVAATEGSPVHAGSAASVLQTHHRPGGGASEHRARARTTKWVRSLPRLRSELAVAERSHHRGWRSGRRAEWCARPSPTVLCRRFGICHTFCIRPCSTTWD